MVVRRLNLESLALLYAISQMRYAANFFLYRLKLSVHIYPIKPRC
jgi:hypothetical protein